MRLRLRLLIPSHKLACLIISNPPQPHLISIPNTVNTLRIENIRTTKQLAASPLPDTHNSPYIFTSMSTNQTNPPDGIERTAHWAAGTSIKYPSHKAVPNAVVNFTFYKRLQDKNWRTFISDEILNFALIQLFHSNSRLPKLIILDTYATKTSSTWVKEISSKTDWDYAIFPINIGNNHWLLAAYSKISSQLLVLDPMGSPRELPQRDHVVFANLGVSPTTATTARSVPLQQDSYNCGLVVIQMARTLSQDLTTIQRLFSTGSWTAHQLHTSAHNDIASTSACKSLRKQLYNDILIASMDPKTWPPPRFQPGVLLFDSR